MAGYLKTTLLCIALSLAGCASGPTHDQMLNDDGYSAMQAGDMQEAERLLMEALDENPHNMQAQFNLATLYERTNRPEQARELYQRVIDEEASAEENGQDPEAAAGLAERARERIAQIDRDEAARQEALREEARRQQEAEQAALMQQAPQEPVAPPPVISKPGHRIQVGAYVVRANAERMQEQLMKRHAKLIEGMDVRMEEDGRMVKVQIGPYESLGDASKACRNFKRAGVDCFPIRK